MLPADTDPSEVHELEPSEPLPFPVRIPNAQTVAAPIAFLEERACMDARNITVQYITDIS